jgi:hypothetical protein
MPGDRLNQPPRPHPCRSAPRALRPRSPRSRRDGVEDPKCVVGPPPEPPRQQTIKKAPVETVAIATVSTGAFLIEGVSERIVVPGAGSRRQGGCERHGGCERRRVRAAGAVRGGGYGEPTSAGNRSKRPPDACTPTSSSPGRPTATHRPLDAASSEENHGEGPGVAGGRRDVQRKAADVGKHAKKVDCPACSGSGETELILDGKKEIVPCKVCGGSGQA